jgi:hypothetical protein
MFLYVKKTGFTLFWESDVEIWVMMNRSIFMVMQNKELSNDS